MKVASFFSGIGGIDLGLERAGMEVIFQCEVNSFCQDVLKKHWPNVILKGDINAVRANDVPKAELWCGGFPCQDLSLANQGKRKGLEGERSGLFYQFAALAKTQKPKWIFMENVPGLLNSQKGEDFRGLLATLDELGYGVSWRVLDAKFFGTPQRRRRVYIVASYRSLRSAEVLFEQRTTPIFNKQSRGEEHSYAPGVEREDRVANYYSIQHAGIGRIPSAGPQAKGYRNDGETYTLDSRGSSDAICQTHDAFGIREITGISGGVDSSRWRSLGNAVAVPVIEWIGKRIIEVDRKYKE